jgi:hypothetical protein
MLFFWYSRGFTAGEALAMSVRNPYQGIWVGDPLAAPFAAPPSVQILSPAPHADLDGDATLQIAVAAHERGAPPVFLDLYIDGRHHAPIARPFAPVGNDLVAHIGTNRFAYTVAPGEDLFAAVAGLAWAVNAKGGGRFTAKAIADRIEVTVREPLGDDGEPLAFSISAEQGFANGLYIGGTAGTAASSRPTTASAAPPPPSTSAPPAPTKSNTPSTSPASNPARTPSASLSATAPPCNASPRPTSPSAFRREPRSPCAMPPHPQPNAS